MADTTRWIVLLEAVNLFDTIYETDDARTISGTSAALLTCARNAKRAIDRYNPDLLWCGASQLALVVKRHDVPKARDTLLEEFHRLGEPFGFVGVCNAGPFYDVERLEVSLAPILDANARNRFQTAIRHVRPAGSPRSCQFCGTRAGTEPVPTRGKSMPICTICNERRNHVLPHKSDEDKRTGRKVALVAMDGNGFGRERSCLCPASGQADNFSQLIRKFSERVDASMEDIRRRVAARGGRWLYGGGDDMQFVLDAEQGIALVEDLLACTVPTAKEGDSQMGGGGTDRSLTYSIGVVIGNDKDDLRTMREIAEGLVGRAKGARNSDTGSVVDFLVFESDELIPLGPEELHQRRFGRGRLQTLVGRPLDLAGWNSLLRARWVLDSKRDGGLSNSSRFDLLDVLSKALRGGRLLTAEALIEWSDRAELPRDVVDQLSLLCAASIDPPSTSPRQPGLLDLHELYDYLPVVAPVVQHATS